MYSAYSILFQLYFEFQFLTKLPRKDFLPWRSIERKKRRLDILNHEDKDFMYLVKLTPRKDIQTILPQDDIKAFNFFVKQNFLNRKSKVIPAIE